MNVRIAVSATTILLLAMTACSPDTTGANGTGNPAPPTTPKPAGITTGATPHGGRPTGTIPIGAGPQKKYTAQPQPAPGSCHYRYTATREPLPDPVCTPGATNPAVTQATIKSTICVPGYTATIRPPSSVTAKEKAGSILAYAYTGNPRDDEYDHFLSLEFGGDPNDARNLWPEPPSPGHKPGSGVSNPKDAVENKLHTAICSGKVTLTAAQEAVVTDWTTALTTLGIS
ncbi:hypothetical protein QMK19_39960 [Streptomyces sp. H10-C2]|uniref:hypothetical protein n=1 Tax=unclassified Streptomyces TaxID=2593676 RepID=UPI0024BAF1A5|nr:MULTISPECIES: hypothetical protein [unclassified Streptomyces]MDJ0347366.1 hypothetical protein [Streptomyces sp. PH10-H1]MDJ0375598.1 hypothetical protein [Streptomyces sp. H10-C2]